MIITPTPGSIIDPLSNVDTPTLTVNSLSPLWYVVYNPVTKVIRGSGYWKGGAAGGPTTKGDILACDTYANLQAAVTAANLTGTLTKDPTLK